MGLKVLAFLPSAVGSILLRPTGSPQSDPHARYSQRQQARPGSRQGLAAGRPGSSRQPTWSRNVATSACPPSAARCSGVRPSAQSGGGGRCSRGPSRVSLPTGQSKVSIARLPARPPACFPCHFQPCHPPVLSSNMQVTPKHPAAPSSTHQHPPGVSGSTSAPRLHRKRATSARPRAAAKCSGHRPCLSLQSSAAPRSTSASACTRECGGWGWGGLGGQPRASLAGSPKSGETAQRAWFKRPMARRAQQEGRTSAV